MKLQLQDQLLEIHPRISNESEPELTVEREHEEIPRRWRFYDQDRFARSLAIHQVPRPKPSTGRVVSRQEFEQLKDIIDGIMFVVGTDEKALLRLRHRVHILDRMFHSSIRESRYSKRTDVNQLRELFGLPKLASVEGDPIGEMRGMLKEYHEEGVDSVEALRRAREE